MRTNVVLGAFLALAVSASLIAGSGFAGVINQGQPAGGIGERLDEAAGESPADQGALEGQRSRGDEGSIVGIVISGARNVATLLGFTLILGDTLQALGAPAWFATTVQSGVTILVGIALIQFATGRVLR